MAITRRRTIFSPLPPELFEQVVELTSGSWDRRHVVCMLRLTCHDLRIKSLDFFGRNYFRTVEVTFFETDLKRLLSISAHPELRCYVKEIKLGPHRLPDAPQIQAHYDFLQRKPQSRETVMFRSDVVKAAVLDQLRGVVRLEDYLSIDHRHIETAMHYTNLLDEQEEMECSGSDVRTLAKALASLPNLKAATLTDSFIFARQDDLCDELGITSLCMALYGECITNATTPASRAFSKLLSAISLAQTKAPAMRIERLSARFADYEPASCLFSMQLGRVQMPSLTGPLLQSLQALKKVDLKVCPQRNLKETDVVNANLLLQCLFSGGQIEEFWIDFQPAGDSGLFADELSTTHFSHLAALPVSRRLRKFTLFGGKPHTKDLATFLLKHAGSLEKVNIGEQQLAGGNWPEIGHALSACNALVGLRLWKGDRLKTYRGRDKVVAVVQELCHGEGRI